MVRFYIKHVNVYLNQKTLWEADKMQVLYIMGGMGDYSFKYPGLSTLILQPEKKVFSHTVLKFTLTVF